MLCRWNNKGRAHILIDYEPFPRVLCGVVVPSPGVRVTPYPRQEPAPQNVCKKCLWIEEERAA